jgi:hypothetical protein
MEPTCPSSQENPTHAPDDVIDALATATDSLRERILVLIANTRNSEAAEHLLRAISDFSDELKAYEKRYPPPVDSVYNAAMDQIIYWTPAAWASNHYFTRDEEKEIVAELPRAVLLAHSYNGQNGEFRIASGLFKGCPQWSNIRYAYINAGETLPTRTFALLLTCKAGAPR